MSSLIVTGTDWGTTFVTGGGGSLVHGNAFTASTSQIVSGTGTFGTKSGSTPSIFDQVTETTGSVGSQWSGAWPNAAASQYNMQIQPNTFRSIGGPHARNTKVYAGCHCDNGTVTADQGNNVMLWKTFTRPAFPFYSYWSYYVRYDPSWAFGATAVLGTPRDDNKKTFDYTDGSGSSPYNPLNWYLQFQNVGAGSGQNANGYFGAALNEDGSVSIQNPDTNGRNTNFHYSRDFGTFNTSDGLSPYSAWRKWEIEIKHSNVADAGYINWWMDGVLKLAYVGKTDGYSGTGRTEGIGGYGRARDNNNYMYFADIYNDLQTTGAARFYLTNNAVFNTAGALQENQKYTSWSSTSVGLIVNRGALSAGTVHLHFRCPVNGNKYLGTATLS